jgi:hypothetical protein
VLCAPLQDDADRTTRLLDLLAEQDEELSVERLLEPEWLVAELLFRLCHEQRRDGGHWSEILIGGVAEDINRGLKDHGEDIRLSPRKVGAVMKSLGVQSERLGSLGRGLRSTPSLARTAHEIAQRLGINRAMIAGIVGMNYGYVGSPCALCDEFDLLAGFKTTGSMQGVRGHAGGAEEVEKFISEVER